MNSSKGRIITIHSEDEDEEFLSPQLASPTQGPVARGEPSASTPIWGQEFYGPFLPTSEEARAGNLPPLPASQQPADRSGPPAEARSRGATGGARLKDSPKSRKTTSNKTSGKKKSVRPTLSIVFDNTPEINESPITSQGFPGVDLPAVLPSGHATPTSPSQVRTRSSRRTN